MKNRLRISVKIIEISIQKVKGKLNTKFSLLITIFPGKLERNGIRANKIIKVPIITRKHPSKKKGDSIFIVKYTIQDEVVNGNVPTLLIPPKNILTQRLQSTQKREKNICIF
jgi:hypothetical protein